MTLNKPRFDATINLGHILTFVGFLATLAAGWVALDKRVTTLEVYQVEQVRRDDAQDYATREQLMLIRQSLQRIEDAQQRMLERESRRLGVAPR